MLKLLAFFADETTDQPGGIPSWVTWVILGVMIVGMVLLMILPQRKQKKRQEEMMSKLAVGSIVTTIGGIVGEVVQMDDKHIWLATGIEGNTTTMQFLRQAIHSIAPAPGSPEAQAEEQAQKEKENEVDEIK